MRRIGMLLILGLVGIVGFSDAMADTLTVLLAKARADLGSKPQVPVYLPSHLPPEIGRYGIKFVLAQDAGNGYSVSLYYSDEPSNASFAGMISGVKHNVPVPTKYKVGPLRQRHRRVV
jgi:hypothetical protein